MNARIELPPIEELTGEIGTLAANWKAMGSDTAFLRMLNYRADLVPTFFDFYMRMRNDGLLPAKLKELVRLRIARLNTCRYCLGSLSPMAEKGRRSSGRNTPLFNSKLISSLHQESKRQFVAIWRFRCGLLAPFAQACCPPSSCPCH